MLKQYILLLSVVFSGVMSSHDLCGFHWYSGNSTVIVFDEDDLRYGELSACRYPSRAAVTEAMLDPELLKLFAITNKLLSILPGEKLAGRCNCYSHRTNDKIELFQTKVGRACLSTPWADYELNKYDRAVAHAAMHSNRFEFEAKEFCVDDEMGIIKITGFKGKVLPSRSFTAHKRCLICAACTLYQSPEEQAARERWSSARKAWVGSVVRSGNARKPVVVVAAEPKE